MIYGVKQVNNIKIRFEQDKNAVDQMLRKRLLEENIHKGWLEGCSFGATCTVLEGMKIIMAKDWPKLVTKTGTWYIGFDDWCLNFVNTPKYDYMFSADDMMDNRSIYVIKSFLERIIGVQTVLFRKKDGGLNWDNAKEAYLKNGKGMIVLRPGHYEAVIGFDTRKDCMLKSNSWTGDPKNINGGWHEPLFRNEWDKKLIYWLVVLG